MIDYSMVPEGDRGMPQHHISGEHDADSFVAALNGLIPAGVAGKILLGDQYGEAGQFRFQIYDGVVPDRFTHLNVALYPADAPSNGQQYVAGTLGLLLDDVGTKVAAPDLAPTCKIETSAGNEQWLYVYSHAVMPEHGHGMARAAAAAGLSDEFIANQNQHWWRLPGSLPKQKVAQGRTEPARLVEWTGTTFTYRELAQALNLDPEAVRTQAYTGGHGFDEATAAKDPVLMWLRSEGHVRESNVALFDRRGFVDIKCPNASRHTDQTRPWARYVPQNSQSRAGFLCHHAHCTDIGLRQLHEWIEDEGGPSAEQAEGYRRELFEVKRQRAQDHFQQMRVAQDEAAAFGAELREEGPEPEVAILFGHAWDDLGVEDRNEAVVMAEDDPRLLVEWSRLLRPKEGMWPSKALTDLERKLDGLANEKERLADAEDLFAVSEAPRMPLDALPSEIGTEIAAFAKQNEMDPSALALFCLSGVASAVGCRAELQMTASYVERMVLWCAGVGDVSAKKSPTIDTAVGVLTVVDHNGQRARASQIETVEQGVHKSRAAKEAALRAVPHARRFITTDATIEKLGDIASRKDQQNNGITMYKDELVGWIGSMDRYSGGKAPAERGHWLTAANAGAACIGRLGRGEQFVSRLGIGVVGGIQADKLRELGKGGGLTSDGLMQRFFFAEMPRMKPTPLTHGGVDCMAHYERRIRRLISGKYADTWKLSEEAREVAIEVSELTYLMASDSDEDAAFLGWLNKSQKHFARLVLAIQLMNPNDDLVVTPEAAESAKRVFLEYLVPTARRVFELISGRDHEDRTQRIGRWLLRLDSEGETEITVRYAQRNGPRVLRKEEAGVVHARLGWLVTAGWLEPVYEHGEVKKYKILQGISEKHRDQLERLQSVRAEIRAATRR